MSNRIKNPIVTRARIMRSAGEEYCRVGLQAARLNTIVEKSGITKGSLFHHFSGKDDLALNWIKETLPPQMEERWINRLEQTKDPIETLKNILRESEQAFEQAPAADEGINFVAALIASVDATNPSLLQIMMEIQTSWHRAVSDALLRGQRDQVVHAAIVASDEAHLILSIVLGCELQIKAMGAAARAGWIRSANAYLDTLRPA